MKKRLLASFSGGRTSAYMTKKLLDDHSDEYEIKVVLANTGQEHERTLEFIRRCDDEFGFATVWVESIPYLGTRKSSGHRVVSYETAARAGEPFAAMIGKYGIPNRNFPHCTRELKLNPIKSYLRSVGWEPGTYATAIGIRTDEVRRVRADADAAHIVYPLVDWFPADKSDVNDWWAAQRFNLEIAEHQGNCTWCWKKSFSKHFRLISESPEIYAFPRAMEAIHGHTGAGSTDEPRVFFRLKTSTDGLFAMERAASPGGLFPTPDPDADGGCSESCELFPMDAAA